MAFRHGCDYDDGNNFANDDDDDDYYDDYDDDDYLDDGIDGITNEQYEEDCRKYNAVDDEVNDEVNDEVKESQEK